MKRYVLALGSNLGMPSENLKRAVKGLATFAKVVEVSPCFETPPLLPPGAPADWFRFFANCAVTIETTLTSGELLARTQSLEQTLGRSSTREKWSPRALDVDLLFTDPYSESQTGTLTIPHPEWRARSFVLAPLIHMRPPKNIPGSALELARQIKNLPPALMAAVNVTPDSFSQTETAINYEQLIAQLEQNLKAGVAFIDLGAESTRPGATPLTWQDEWQRLEPVLDHWRSVASEYPFSKLSVDTYHAETAQRALDSKVSVLNDVTHLASPAMRELAPHFDSVILMHSLTVPADKTKTWPPGTDGILELKTWFAGLRDSLPSLSDHQLIFDPGLGFGKTPLQSLQILQRFGELADLPVRRLIGHSRKSFMANWSATPAHDRDVETLGASLALTSGNIEILRVHNVDWHQRALRSASAVLADP